MQAILDHLNKIVRPALRAFLAAQQPLVDAKSMLPDAAAAIRGQALLAARTATIELHQFADVVLNEPSGGALPTFADVGAVRTEVRSHCRFLRGPIVVDDVSLLRDVADAFKHHRPDRKSATVAGAGDVISVSTGWGKLRWGEGTWGGAEQLIVTRKDGDQRALSSILQNVFDAWMTLLNQPLPAIGAY